MSTHRSTSADSSGPARTIALWLATFGVVACFTWGVAEALVFFIVPDVIVGAVALFHPRKWLKAATAAIVGSLLGGVVLYTFGVVATGWTQDLVSAVPGIPSAMVDDVRRNLADHGGAALVRAPLSGIPYKLYVTEMAAQSWNLVVVLLWSIPSRALRIVPAALAAGAVGHALRRAVGRWPAVSLALYGVVWLGVYVAYFAANGF